MSECEIEDAILNNLDRLGFSGALAIRRCRMGEHAGTVDLAILPKRSRTKLVLVEAKCCTAPDAASKVIGQLLMYYGGALTLGRDGVKYMRKHARRHKSDAESTIKKSPHKLVGGKVTKDQAWGLLQGGPRLQPDDIKLFIALDGCAHRALEPTIFALRERGLDIGLIRTDLWSKQ